MRERQTPADRLRILFDAVAPGERARAGVDELIAQLAPHFEQAGDDVIWLALSVLRAEFPMRERVIEVRRDLRLRGSRTVLRKLAHQPARGSVFSGRAVPTVRVVREATVVDVHHTARTGLATGIQRVVRKTIDEWVKDRELVLVGWGPGFGGLRELSSAERENALYGTQAHADRPKQVEVTVPWRSRYILPELAIETDRTARIACLAEFSGNSTAMIGFDCVPLTSAETVAAGMGAAFARNLVAAAQFDKIGTISAAAATEYGGWATMQTSAGISGPEVREVLLPFEAGEATDAQLAEFAAVLLTGDLPMLLCVGSHEPRKNHMAVLHAAETLWRKGREFSVVFIGGNSWGSDPFRRQLASLQKAGRPVQSISAVSDELLWSAYRLARGTVFPSWNEGFGLPVAESIAAGTPVVTSNFGSMKEIAAGGGAVLADPRDDDDIIRALDLMLFDDDVNARLRVESRSRPLAEWSDYASQLWDYFSGTA